MAKKNVARLKPVRRVVRLGDSITINVDEVKQGSGDLDPTALVVVRNRVQPAANQPGFWGSFLHKDRLNAVSADYTAKERGIHVLVLTVSENGVVQTYRSNPIEVT